MILADKSDDDLALAGWHSGLLYGKLSEKQREVYGDIKRDLWGSGGYIAPDGPQRRYILKCCRRFGKTFIMGVLAVELCLRRPDARVYWAAETAKQVKNMIRPNMRIILQDCPAELRPTYNTTDGVWTFPTTGAEIHVAGCEDESKADRLRGDGADLFILDEAGHIAPLQYVYRSIALWMTARRRGRIVMPSSPAKSPGHAFTNYSILAEGGEGGYSHRTVYESDLDSADIEDIAKECGGKDTTDWLREGMALDVVDQDRAIIPEFTALQEELVREVERPKYFAPLVAMDVGFHPDLTAVIFSYWHQERGLLVVEDEIELSQATTDHIASTIRAKELELWGEHWTWAESIGVIDEDAHFPHQRVSDVAKQLLHDLSELHSLPFMAVVKSRGDGERSFVEATVNQVRMLVKHKQVAIHPRCKGLISHLKAGIWNNARNSWERLDGYGHFDFIDALRYQVRHLDRQHDPTPIVDPDRVSDTTHISTRRLQELRRERDGDVEELAASLAPDLD